MNLIDFNDDQLVCALTALSDDLTQKIDINPQVLSAYAVTRASHIYS